MSRNLLSSSHLVNTFASETKVLLIFRMLAQISSHSNKKSRSELFVGDILYILLHIKTFKLESRSIRYTEIQYLNDKCINKFINCNLLHVLRNYADNYVHAAKKYYSSLTVNDICKYSM